MKKPVKTTFPAVTCIADGVNRGQVIDSCHDLQPGDTLPQYDKPESEYDKQASDFLTRNGLKFRATLSDSKAPQWGDDSKHGHHYRVTISRPADDPKRYREPVNNFPQASRPPRLVFDFWSSIADMEKGIRTVTPYSVLACISGDAYTPETFEDFCAEYGYETDSIRALQTFRRCSAFAKRLRAFFTEAELEQLSEIQ